MPIRASGIWLMFKGCRWQKTNFITNKEGKSLAYAGGKESRVTQRIEGGEWAPGPPGPEQEVEVIRTHFLTTTPLSLDLCLSVSLLLSFSAWLHLQTVTSQQRAWLQKSKFRSPPHSPPQQNKTIISVSPSFQISVPQVFFGWSSFGHVMGLVYTLTHLWWLMVQQELCSLFQITELSLGSSSPDKDFLSQPQVHLRPLVPWPCLR